MIEKQKDIVKEYIAKDINVLISGCEFFDDITCRFSVDGIEDLRKILSIIVNDSPNTEVYVLMNYDELIDNKGNEFWYSDSIIISTDLSVKQISAYFKKSIVEPSDICIVDEDILLVNSNGEIHQINNKCRNMINLYWD